MGEMTKQRINNVIRTTATVASEADFMLTHMPFKALVDYVRPRTNSAKVSYTIDNELYKSANVFGEDNVLDGLIDEPDKHKFIMIQGKNGSGKSHLVRWLFYNYRKHIDLSKEETIFIPRAHNTLKDTIKDILETNVLEEDRKQEYLKKVQGNDASSMGPEETREAAFEMLKVIIKFDESEVISKANRERLYYFMEDNIVKHNIFLKENGAIDRLCNKMEGTELDGDGNPFSVDNICFNQAEIIAALHSAQHKADKGAFEAATRLATDKSLRMECCQYLNSLVEVVIRRISSFKGEDLNGIFEEIRAELKKRGKRLSLFIEDINSFTGIDQNIIEVLVQNHEEHKELCRIASVIGSTDYFFDKFNNSLRERLTRNIVILESALFKKEDWIVEFAARYINAINISEEESQNWLIKNEEQIPIWKSDYGFSDVVVDGSTMSVFPFNARALINLYNLLPETSKTPRCFLRDVIKHIELKWIDYGIGLLNSENNFCNESIANLGMFLTDEDEIKNNVNKPEEKVKRGVLLKIWGDKTFKLDENGNLGGVSKDIFDFFEIESIKTIVEKSDVPVEKEKKEEKRELDEEVLLREKLLSIDQWANGTVKEFKMHREVRELVARFILRTINWEVEDFSYELAQSVLKDFGQIYIEGQSVSGNGIIYLDRSDDVAEMMKALLSQKTLAKGRGWDFANGETYYIYAHSWLLKNKRNVVETIKQSVFGSSDIKYLSIKAAINDRLLSCNMESLNENSIIKIIFRSIGTDSCVGRWDKWESLYRNTRNEKDSINEFTKILFRAVVGDADITNCKYIFIDALEVETIVKRIIEEGITRKPEHLLEYRFDGKYGLIISSLRKFYDEFEDCIAEEYMHMRTIRSKIVQSFGERVTEKQLGIILEKIETYFSFIRNDIKFLYNPAEYRLLNMDNKGELFGLIEKCFLTCNEEDVNERILKLSHLNLRRLAQYAETSVKFEHFIDENNSRFNSAISSETKKQIAQCRKNIENALVM